MIAIGVGCRRGASADAIEALVRRAMAQLPTATGEKILCSGEPKTQEPGLHAVAARLGMALRFVPIADLQAAESRVTIRSSAALAAHGVASMAEAAALAVAGAGAKLVVTKLTADGVTCAVAYSKEEI